MKNYTFELNQQQIKVINDGLMSVPFGLAAPVIEELNKQIQLQFDIAKGDDPTGQEKPKDEFVGD